MNVIIAGGRSSADAVRIGNALATAHAATPITLLLCSGGGATVVAVVAWARKAGVRVLACPANWEGAGLRPEHRPARMIAFAGNARTANDVARARAAGLPVDQR